MCGFGASKPMFGGMWPRCTANTALMKPAIPAAASKCPRFDLMAPINSGKFSGRPRPSTVPSARASMGSPKNVPVPWVST